MCFRENLKNELDYQGLKVKDLAIKTGINRKTIDNYLTKNSNDPSASNAVKIAAVLGLSVEYLITGETANTQKKDNFLVQTQKFSKLLGLLANLDELDIEAVTSLAEHLQKRYEKKE